MVNYKSIKLSPGLYFVSTPIGTARDITLRALDILASVDVLAAEDTRTLKKLLEIHGIQLKNRTLISYHDHNGSKIRPKILDYLEQGKSIAYASEAGTPLIADPGFSLLSEVINSGKNVTSAPGPCALIAALTIGGPPKKMRPIPSTMMTSSLRAGTYAPPAVQPPSTTESCGRPRADIRACR